MCELCYFEVIIQALNNSPQKQFIKFSNTHNVHL